MKSGRAEVKKSGKKQERGDTFLQEEKKPSKNPVWSFFSSVRLTLFLLLLIALAAIVGTVIPQQDAAGEAVQKLPPALAGVLKVLQLHDLYRSPWFLLLMALLTVNLVVCSLNRLPASLRLYRRKPEPDRPGLYEDLPPGQVLAAEGTVEDEAARMEQVLIKALGSVERKGTDQATWLSGHKGAWSYFGVYVIHAGVLVIILGAVIGSLLGFDGYVNMKKDNAHKAAQDKVLKSYAQKQNFTILSWPEKQVPLGGRVLFGADDGHKILTGDMNVPWFMLKGLAAYYMNRRARRLGPTNTNITLGPALAGRLRLSLMDRGIPLWLLKEYLGEIGGVELEPDTIQGAGWKIELEQLDDFQVGSIRVGQVRLELEADPAVYAALNEALEKKLIRAGG